MMLPSSGIHAAKDSAVGSALPMLAEQMRIERSSLRSIIQMHSDALENDKLSGMRTNAPLFLVFCIALIARAIYYWVVFCSSWCR